MSLKIDIKHSSTPGLQPTTSSINLAEVAFNTYDGKVYYKKDSGTESISEFVSTTHTGSVSISGSTTINGDLTILSGSGDLYVHGHKQFNYGVFQHNQTITGSANVSYSFQLDTTDEADGVSIVSGSRITFNNAGVYDLQFSAQVAQVSAQGGQGAGKATIHIWFKRNGTNIPESDTKLNVNGDDYAVAAWNFMKTFNAGDYAEIVWQSDLSTTTFPFEPATGNFPAVPSIIVTVNQVR